MYFHFFLQNWYCLSKTEAESEAMEFAKRTGLDVVAVCPTLVLGPILQSNVNASSLVLIKLLKGTYVATHIIYAYVCGCKVSFGDLSINMYNK